MKSEPSVKSEPSLKKILPVGNVKGILVRQWSRKNSHVMK